MQATRVLIVSQRDRPDGFGRKPGYVSFSEAEDVLADATDADIYCIDTDPSQVGVRARRFVGRSARRATGLRLPPVGPSTRALPLGWSGALRNASVEQPAKEKERHYDVAVFIAFTLWDLTLLEGIPKLRELADTVIVWFPEAWASEFADRRLRFEPFDMADVLFVGMRDTTSELQAVAPGPVYYMPPAADVTRFAADRGPHDPRPIDVLGIGRRDPSLHDALLDWARKNQALYVYDTIGGSEVRDVAAHRRNLGDTYRRSSIAITNYAKYDVPSVIGRQRETPGRLWEGLASGALLVGYPPDESLQRALLGESLVIDLPRAAPQAIDLIDELNRDDHSARRRYQAQLALRGHDWAHRWRRIFELSAIPVPAGLLARTETLAAMADQLDGCATPRAGSADHD